MTKLKTIELTLSSDWACSLINSDDSGLDDSEIDQLELTLQYHQKVNNIGLCLGCSEDTEITRFHDMRHSLLTECLTYTFEVLPEVK